ncbi:MAG: hypothetical protein H0X58_05955 [Acidimicrobiia bacterium]|nr:hypothetical protein [Acidimicrobiia bacterium]
MRRHQVLGSVGVAGDGGGVVGGDDAGGVDGDVGPHLGVATSAEQYCEGAGQDDEADDDGGQSAEVAVALRHSGSRP